MEDRKEMHKDDVNNQNNHTGARAAEDVPIGLFRPSHPKEKPSVDMREVVGKKIIYLSFWILCALMWLFKKKRQEQTRS